jgi:hypothetical protein
MKIIMIVVRNRLGTDTQERVPTGFTLCSCDSACPADLSAIAQKGDGGSIAEADGQN